jgi:glutathione S-transferase
MAKNPSGQLPALELDNGMVLAEITAICEYLDEIGPAGKSLIGSTPIERAETRMWVRRIDLGYVEPMANGFRATEGRPMFAPRFSLTTESAGAELKALAAEKLLWIDSVMTGDFVCGDRFTLADILLFCFIEFGGAVGQPMPGDTRWLAGWHARVKARPSAKA